MDLTLCGVNLTVLVLILILTWSKFNIDFNSYHDGVDINTKGFTSTLILTPLSIITIININTNMMKIHAVYMIFTELVLILTLTNNVDLTS